MSGKIVIYDYQARKKLKAGVDALANAVKVTLGPTGRHVALGESYGSPRVTKDGVTVAREIELKDLLENVGAQMVKQAATQTHDLAGDGTTTATLLAQAIVSAGIKYINSGANPMDVKRGIDKGVDVVVKEYEKMAKQVKTKEDIAQVATISANNDAEIGNLIAEVMDKVGKNGVVTVEEGSAFKTEVEYVEGMQFDKGYISPYFITDADKLEAVMEDPYILITDKKISSVQDITPLLENIVQGGNKSLMIIADDVDSQALATLVLNKLRGVLKVCAVKAPGFGDRRKEMLQDIAILTGGQVITEELGRDLQKVEITDLGQAKKILVGKEKTVVVDGAGSEKDIKARIQTINREIEAATSDYDKEKLQERLAKLSGGVAVIKAGAPSEVELKEVKDRIDDALSASRAAVEEGVVSGGGVAYYEASKVLDKLEDSLENEDQKLGVKILKRALEEPIRQIAKNSGAEPGVILAGCKGSTGYNAKQGKFVNMLEAGIADPTKVARLATIHAASVASMVLTTETVVVDDKEDKEEAPAMPAGEPGMGMGGMGGMM